jgi:hypothetical protein
MNSRGEAVDVLLENQVQMLVLQLLLSQLCQL